MTTGMGMGPMIDASTRTKGAGRPLMMPRVHAKRTPSTKIKVPSVATKGGMLRLVISRPFIRPTAAPMPRQMTMAMRHVVVLAAGDFRHGDGDGAHDRADRQVDAAAQDDHRLTDADDAEHGRCSQHVEHIREFVERGGEHC